MRSIARAVLGGAVGLAGVLAPLVAPVPATLAAAPPKVVIIVGPVGSATDSYRSDADDAATEALKYTSNVVKIYSPNATWAAVKPALQGASIVIYMGHGNGFPSPYTSTIQPDREDGLGLNPTAGTDDTKTQYYGEQYVASDVLLAPNAVVFLGHLCYASGSSEPGYADPTLTVAEQRVDNFAAGFLAAGARAVIAEAYGGSAAYYVGALFTAHDTLGNIWANSPSQQGNALSFASTRTPGMTAQMDPDKGSGKYYRAFVGDPNLRSDDVTGSTSSSPAPSPGPSNPGPTGSPSPAPSPTPTPTPDPSGDESKTSVTVGGPTLTSISAPRVFSPNGDGRQDTFRISARLSSPVQWLLTISDAQGTPFSSASGSGDAIDVDWDGTSSGSRLPDGRYTYHLVATDGFGGALDRTGSVRIDTAPPAFSATQAPSALTSFSPNGDGAADTWKPGFSVSEPATLEATVISYDGIVVRHLTATTGAGSTSLAWDGRSDAGNGVADGRYLLIALARDTAGNPSTSVSLPVSVYRALSKVAAAPTVFYPQDQDALAPATAMSFVLNSAANVTWTIANAKGQTVATRYQGMALAPGPVAWSWAGTDQAGRAVPAGTYVSIISVTDGTLTSSSRTTLTVAAFKITASPTSATRGQNVTVTAVSAEPLLTTPRVTISQPGVAARSLAMTKVAANTYRVTTRLAASGSAGVLVLKVSATDAGHGQNVATASVSLR